MFCKKVFLKILQNSQRNTCATVFSINTGKGLQVVRLAILLKKDPHTGVSELAA